jgi:hypothetical protein
MRPAMLLQGLPDEEFQRHEPHLISQLSID